MHSECGKLIQADFTSLVDENAVVGGFNLYYKQREIEREEEEEEERGLGERKELDVSGS